MPSTLQPAWSLRESQERFSDPSLSEPEVPDFALIPDPPFPSEIEVLNLHQVRLRFGADLLAVFRVEQSTKAIVRVAGSASEGAVPSEQRRLDATEQALASLHFDHWNELYRRTKIKLREPTAVFDQTALISWFAGRLSWDECPYSAAVGWLVGKDEGPSLFYVVAWLSGVYEIKIPLNTVVKRVDYCLRALADKGISVVARPVAGYDEGRVTDLPAGTETYMFRRPLDWVFEPAFEQLNVEGFSPALVGEGKDRASAWDDFLQKIDVYFQALHLIQPFRRTEDQERIWRLLDRFLDIDRYLAQFRRITMNEVRVGATVYLLTQPFQGEYTLGENNRVEFRSAALGEHFVGYGRDFDSALRDWREAIHSAFQTLYRRPRFEMSDYDRERWNILGEVIDVETYALNTPVRLRQIGYVSGVRPSEIRWENGSVEAVTLDQMPREFATFEPGQWFEARLGRDPKTWALREVVDVEAREPSSSISGDALENFWSGLTPTSALPESTERWSSPREGDGGTAP